LGGRRAAAIVVIVLAELAHMGAYGEGGYVVVVATIQSVRPLIVGRVNRGVIVSGVMG
jgi:hypothetical protein